ncbi:alcohol dehydrogenase catalytic domain-containing protein [Janibacter melonis]|uniref:alcohol dehydrogenase catalytic domain-containing protein n=1 Tax=Janibacter melonis TaxID=262209 RepID=UPI002966B50E|nr:alcohol dehydrogenase catalytic domain-containing protein [Janibacter melonis]
MSAATAAVPETMRAAVLRGVGDIAVEERPVPTPGLGEVLVEIAAVGVCGSDTHYLLHGRIGPHVVREPLVLGHEASGRVVAVGEGVDPARVGERVSLEPGVPCGTCPTCRSGRYNLCPQMVFHATPPVDGSMQQHVAIHASMAHPVPDEVSDVAAAMLEPLSVGIWACRRAEVALGDRVLVTGAGPVGLLAAQVARASGADVVVSDVAPQRRAVAAALGLRLHDPAEETAGAGPGPVEVLLECSGPPSAVASGLEALAPAGRAVLVGMGGDEVSIPLSILQDREVSITGTFRYAGTWPTAIALAASGAVVLDTLPVRTFALDDAAAALTAGRDDPGLVKALVVPGQARTSPDAPSPDAPSPGTSSTRPGQTPSPGTPSPDTSTSRPGQPPSPGSRTTPDTEDRS